VRRLSETEIINAANKQIENLRKQAEAAETAEAAYERYREEALKNIELEERMGNAFGAQQFRDAIETYKYGWDEAVRKAETTRARINTELAKIGKRLGEDFAIIDIPVALSVDSNGFDSALEIASEAKKRWQEWYGEITKVDPAQFGESGARAAELYLAEFSRSLEAGKTVFAGLGEEFNAAEALRGQQADIQKALVELFSINPANINAQFTTIDESIKPLIEEYKRLGEAAKTAEDAMKAAAVQKEFEQTIADITRRIDDFGKSERQLAHEAELARIGLSAQSDQARELMEIMDAETVTRILSELDKEVQNLSKDQYDLALATLTAAGAMGEEIERAEKLIRQLKEAKKETEDTQGAIESLGKSLVNLVSSAALSGIEELGRAFGQGAESEEAMRNAMVTMSQEILNALPNLFLQAGLQLIARGEWSLGLGLIAAAGASAFIKGNVYGRIEAEQAAQANAHGNIFEASGIQAFARGGLSQIKLCKTRHFSSSRGEPASWAKQGRKQLCP